MASFGAETSIVNPACSRIGTGESREHSPTAARRAPFWTRSPWLSLALVLAALGASHAPGSVDALAFRRAAFEGGEAWRVITMHFVHPWPRLALFDLGALFLLGLALERRSRSLLVSSVGAAGLFAATAVIWLRTDLESYQGASALVAGVWTALAIECISRREHAARATGALLLLAWIGKTTAEFAGHWPASMEVLPPGVERVAEAHLAGGFGGAVAAVAALRRTRMGNVIGTPLRWIDRTLV
jgi:membrane associated rhomboid family serine protease